jgi:hypothetical protein
MPLQSKTALVWRISVAWNNKTLLGLRVISPYIFAHFKQNLGFFWTGFHESQQYIISWKSVQRGAALIHADGRI